MSRSRKRGKKQPRNATPRLPVRSRRTGWLAAGCALLVAALIGTGAWWFHRAAAEAVVIPELSDRARAGARLFAASCAVCHGENATGTEQGPPLLPKIYEPGHHPDRLFQRAVSHGGMSHHWPFGHMPPVPGLSRKDVSKIIAFVRELQRANGIY